MPLLAPAFNKIIDCSQRFLEGRADYSELEQSAQEAQEFFDGGRRLYERILPAILRNEEVETVLAHCLQDLDAQDSALKSIVQHAANNWPEAMRNAIESLENAGLHLAEDFHQLSQLERKEKIYSPFPAIDNFIKTGLNVLEGHAQPQDLINRFPPVAELGERLRRDNERFGVLYDAPQITGLMNKLVPNLQAGLGACWEYFQTQKKSALADGLKLLGRGSSAVFSGLKEMDKFTSSLRQSRHSYLDEFNRSIQAYRENRLEWKHVLDAWQLVRSAADNYHNDLVSFRHSPLSPFLSAQQQQAEQALGSVNYTVESLDALLKQKEIPNTSMLEVGFDNLFTSVDRLWQDMETLVKRYKKAKNVQALRERVGRTLLGEPASIMRDTLEDFLNKQAEFDNSILAPELAEEMDAIIVSQNEACQMMLSACDSGDMEILRQGWDLLEQTMPRLLQINEMVRHSLQPAESSAPKTVKCLRCGAENPSGEHYCHSCRAILVASVQAPTEYTDITSPQAEVSKRGPSRLLLIRDSINKLLAGEIAPETLSCQFDELASLVVSMHMLFMQRTMPKVKENDLDIARYFNEQLTDYAEGLVYMRSCLLKGAYSELHQGLEACQTAQDNLLTLTERICTM